MFVHLPKSEIYLYFSIYVIFLLYGIFNIYSLKDALSKSGPYGFVEGWKLIGRKRDDSDYEWENFKSFICKNYLWYLGHITFSEVCRILFIKKSALAHAIVGLVFILATYNIQTCATIFLQIIISYLISTFNMKICTWLLASIWIVSVNILKTNTSLYKYETYEEYYEMLIALSWNVLKCISFSLSKIHCYKNNGDTKAYNIWNFLGYTLYFPTFIYGPFMIFDRYITYNDNVHEDRINYDFEYRIYKLLKNFLRIGFWLMFTDFALHFIYINFLEQNIMVIKLLNSWALYGFGYLMGQFFHLHYVVSYGLGIAIAKFDRIDAPEQPKCIGRIHFYSDMWKHFDQGLYEFLFRYIYSSLCSKASSNTVKILSSIVTFCFIYIWHGLFTYVLIWTVLNFLCLCFEKIFKYTIKSHSYQSLIGKYLSSANQMRLYGLIGTQVFIPSAISNFYFFAGEEVGHYFMARTYQSGVLNYISLTICCYCIFQCSEKIAKWNHSKK